MTTTTYHDDNLPDELNVETLPEDLFDEAFAALVQAMSCGELVAQEAKAAYVYDRKDYLSTDALGGKRNASYGGNSDDVVLQVTVRISSPYNNRSLDKTAALEKNVRERRLEAEKERLEAEIAADEAVAEKARTDAARKREQLRTLGETR